MSEKDIERVITEKIVNISAPPEEMKAFTAGLRVGYKAGYGAGYADGVMAAKEPTGIIPSEVLYNKPNDA